MMDPLCGKCTRGRMIGQRRVRPLSGSRLHSQREDNGLAVMDTTLEVVLTGILLTRKGQP